MTSSQRATRLPRCLLVMMRTGIKGEKSIIASAIRNPYDRRQTGPWNQQSFDCNTGSADDYSVVNPSTGRPRVRPTRPVATSRDAICTGQRVFFGERK